MYLFLLKLLCYHYPIPNIKSQKSLVASQVRLQQWARQIHECKSRPAGMKVETWCSQNGITKSNYYYRLRRVREAYIETTQSSETTFVELPVMSESEKSEKQESKNLPVARIHTDDNLSIDIFSSISADQIQSLIGAVTNVK